MLSFLLSPFVPSTMLRIRDCSRWLVPNGLISLKENGEKTPGVVGFALVKFSDQTVRDRSSPKTASPNPLSSISWWS